MRGAPRVVSGLPHRSHTTTTDRSIRDGQAVRPADPPRRDEPAGLLRPLALRARPAGGPDPPRHVLRAVPSAAAPARGPPDPAPRWHGRGGVPLAGVGQRADG